MERKETGKPERTCTNVRQEGVAETGTLGSTLDETGNVDDGQVGGDLKEKTSNHLSAPRCPPWREKKEVHSSITLDAGL